MTIFMFVHYSAAATAVFFLPVFLLHLMCVCVFGGYDTPTLCNNMGSMNFGQNFYFGQAHEMNGLD